MDQPTTSINGRIVDAVAQTDVMVVGQSPAMAMASLYQNLAQASAFNALNAVYAQQQTNIAFQAATARAVRTLLDQA